MNQHLDPQAHAAQQSAIPTSVITGVVISLVILLCEGGVSYAYARYQGRQVRRGWNLIPVTALAADTPGGPLNAGSVTTLAIPEQFATSSVVTPDRVSLVMAHELIGPMKKGTPLRWCDVRVDFERLVFAARDLKAGETVSSKDFTARTLPKERATASTVKEADQAEFEGRTLAVSLRAGDPLLSTFFSEARK